MPNNRPLSDTFHHTPAYLHRHHQHHFIQVKKFAQCILLLRFTKTVKLLKIMKFIKFDIDSWVGAQGLSPKPRVTAPSPLTHLV